jgi:acyl-CoA thioesterase FadM
MTITSAPIISADSHITEPPDTYTARIDARFRDRAPRLIHDAKRGDLFVIDGLDMRTEERGLSTFEFQLTIAGPLRTGQLVRVQSALVHVGNSSLRLFHRMTNARTGDEIAILEQSGVHLDREARRPTPLPDALRAKTRAMLAATAD